MKAINIILYIAMVSFFAIGCTKHEDFTNEVFDCECGTLTIESRDLSVRLAEGFVPDSSSPDMWRYHIVADYRTEEERINHIPSKDTSLTIDIAHSGLSASDDAFNVMTAQYIHVPYNAMWDISQGSVEVSVNDGTHTVTLSNILADGNLINGSLMVDFQ